MVWGQNTQGSSSYTRNSLKGRLELKAFFVGSLSLCIQSLDSNYHGSIFWKISVTEYE